MARVKRGVTSHAKHKKVYKAAKGYFGRRKNTIRVAKQAVEKAGQYAFRDRKRMLMWSTSKNALQNSCRIHLRCPRCEPLSMTSPSTW